MAEHDDERPLETYEEWKRQFETGDVSPGDKFSQTSHIALLLAYDLIDKLRWWEKETLQLSDDEIAQRLERMARLVEELRSAYLTLAESDF